ncbi:MAG: PhzF family phenazine biosynthesis protein, partial [Phaeodactylibacter sp.]|nr:PhzF family phenazine biosynthesis protein [Phaeodactylibacter sp.]
YFETLSGRLSVKKTKKGYRMEFPVDMPRQVTPPAVLQEAFAGRLKHCFKATDDFMVVLSSEGELAQLSPDIKAIAGLESRGLIITAPGDETDFVSRCFFPRYGIDEDPVTGSAHTVLTPYWAARLGKSQLSARQISKRGGEIECKLEGGRVFLTGQAVTYLSGTIFI